MLIAIETAADVGGVALLEGDRLLAEVILAEGAPYNTALMPALDHLLRTCGRRLEEVAAIALSIGPGSFTGLRVGLATALGLCFGTERSIVAVPTLGALSLHAGDAPRIAPLLDARKGQVYAGLYGPRAEPLGEDRVTDPIPWLSSLAEGEEIAFLGPGAALYRNEIESVLGARARFLARSVGWPRAETVGLLGERLRRQGAALPPEEVELRYLRLAEAEERRRGVPRSAGTGR